MVELELVLSVLAVLGGAVVGTVAWLRARRMAPVRDQLFGLPIQWSGETEGRLHVEGVPVEVRARYHDHQLVGLTFRWPERGLGIELEPESLPGRLTRGDLVLGDPRFDDAVRVGASDDAVALAVFDDAARRAVRRVLEAGATFTGDRWVLSGDAVGDGRLESLFLRIHRAHVALRPPAGPAALRDALAARATTDPVVGVRAHALDVLVRRGLADDALLARCEGDLQPGIRLAAARARGPRGATGLGELMRRGSRTVRFEAALALLALGPDPDALDVLVDALADDELVEAAAAGLERHGSADRLPAMGAAHQARPHRAIEAAMAALRVRVGDARAGALALAGGGGQVSLAEPSDPLDDQLPHGPGGVLHGEQAVAGRVGDDQVGP